MIYKRGCDKKGPNGTCSKCRDRGSCGVYCYKFMWQGRLIRESTHQSNDKVARSMESAHRTSLAKGEVGLREKHRTLTLNDFLTQRFEPWAKARFEHNVPKTWEWYLTAMKVILKFKPFTSALLAVLADTGMRPEECYRLRWEAITWTNGRHGSLFVMHGKTKAARRPLPMTPRVRDILEARWESAGKPDESWVWPAPTRSGHVEVSSLRKQHARPSKRARCARSFSTAYVTRF